MSNIRIMAAAATIITALTFAPASARPCDDNNGPCNSVEEKPQADPLSLSPFVTPEDQATVKPRRYKKKLLPRATAKQSKPPVTDTIAQPNPSTLPAPASKLAPRPPAASETDGVAIASVENINELDAAADLVLIVAANELNEIDLAADATLVAAQNETMTTTATAETAALADHPSGDASWIGRIFVALGGMLAAASVARLFIA